MAGVGRRMFLGGAASAAAAAGVGVAGGLAPAPAAAKGGRSTRSGADVLAAEDWKRLSGDRLGIVTNPTGVISEGEHALNHIVDAMHASGAVDVAAVFGPEHGFRGTAQAGGSEGDYTDPRTGIPVYDAYGVDADELAAMFRDADVERVVFDIADVGARFYTYIWTMWTAMRAAAKAGLGMVVLDRPNPIGDTVDGPLLDPEFASGVGKLPIVQQHGMTAGELALMFDAEHLPEHEERLEQLDVVGVRGWRRERTFDETGLPWVVPSPNMPTPDTAALYPGTALFEGTLLSEGRGTTRPFEIIGAPDIDWRWAEEINAADLPGVRAREAYFVPTFSKHAGETCGGVQLLSRGAAKPITTAVTMLVTARRLYPEVFGWREDMMIDKLSGSDRLRTMIDAGAGTGEVVGAWEDEVSRFCRDRRPYLLYN
ncbi:uncharacterized protein YbbC (DUF1343 family) [Haloactinospora alba]|uniref:Uncharacterized protein YbbC (DUF1343 family) n=1 Tax=Haloactinospora alba TaxID=405555 RepID=A0A543NNI8_9ACTN|nr:DUF1343 domain-containing protein [Haloactinospora alba]TQN33357.1 uncharacterized protein YbbC (DUF1343 family) [Haloactinospora alba]